MKKFLLVLTPFLILSCGGSETTEDSSSSTEDTEENIENSGPDYADFTSSVGDLSCGRGYVFANGDTVENKVVFGSYLEAHIPELSGFTIENNKINVLTQHLFKSSDGKDTVLFSSFDDNGVLSLDASDTNNIKLVQGFPIGYPAYHHEDGSATKEYTWKIEVKDAATGEILSLSTRLKIKANSSIKMGHTDTPFNYKEIALYNQTTERYVTNDSVTAPGLFVMEFFGLEDITKGDEGVRLGISLKIKDENGNYYVEDEDIADGYKGFVFMEVKKQLSVQFVIPDKDITEKINVAIRVWDKNSYDNLDHHKELKVNMDLVIKNFEDLQ